MKKLLLLVILFSSMTAVAQSDPQKLIDEFFNRYKNKSPDDAVDYIFGTNKYMAKSTEQIENVKYKLNSAVTLIGKYYGYDFLTKKTAGPNLIIYTFLVRYDRQPLRFNFAFYRANDQWVIFNYSFDDSVTEELKEATKISLLKENLE